MKKKQNRLEYNEFLKTKTAVYLHKWFTITHNFLMIFLRGSSSLWIFRLKHGCILYTIVSDFHFLKKSFWTRDNNTNRNRVYYDFWSTLIVVLTVHEHFGSSAPINIIVKYVLLHVHPHNCDYFFFFGRVELKTTEQCGFHKTIFQINEFSWFYGCLKSIEYLSS